jgi:hypothetical protein
MRSNSRRSLLVLLNALLLVCCTVPASSQIVAIQVSDLKDRPVAHAILSTKGSGSTSAPTDIAGKTQVQLPTGIQVGDELALVLVNSGPKPLRILSPWQGRAVVPRPQGFIEVVLGQVGDRAALENHKVLAALAAEVLEKNKQDPGDFIQRQYILESVSYNAGFKAAEVDAAIREVAKDPKEDKYLHAYVVEYPGPPMRRQDRYAAPPHHDH